MSWRLYSEQTLISYWPLNNHARDLMRGNNGTWSGTAGEQYDNGPFGRKMGSFAGSNELITVAAAGMPAGNSPRSFFCWVKFDASSALDYLFGYGKATSYQECSFGRSAGNVLLLSRSGGTVTIGATALITGPWWHVGITYDGATAYGYVNGNQDGSGAVDLLTVLETNAYLGRNYAGGAGSYLDGIMGEAWLYNVCLTPDEAKTLFRKFRGR